MLNLVIVTVIIIIDHRRHHQDYDYYNPKAQIEKYFTLVYHHHHRHHHHYHYHRHYHHHYHHHHHRQDYDYYNPKAQIEKYFTLVNLFGYLGSLVVFICTDRPFSTISYKFTSFSSSETMHLSTCVGLAITIVVVSPNDSVLRVTLGEVLAGEAGAEAWHS